MTISCMERKVMFCVVKDRSVEMLQIVAAERRVKRGY